MGRELRAPAGQGLINFAKPAEWRAARLDWRGWPSATCASGGASGRPDGAVEWLGAAAGGLGERAGGFKFKCGRETSAHLFVCVCERSAGAAANAPGASTPLGRSLRAAPPAASWRR